MEVLLDTQILIWAAVGSPKLSQPAIDIIEAPENRLRASVLSIWEVTLKRSKLRIEFGMDEQVFRQSLLENDIEELPLFGEHITVVGTLPFHHTDPFDRLLVAQAISEGMTLLTSDRELAQYGPSVRVV
jgi:PIN domain nuclease of toxin-antitoxin system